MTPTPFRSSLMILLKACFNIEILTMDFKISETNKGEKSLIYESYFFRIDNVLKSSDILVGVSTDPAKQDLEQTVQ